MKHEASERVRSAASNTCACRAHVLRLSERADVRNNALAGDEIHIGVSNYRAKKIVMRAEHVENSFDVGYVNLRLCAARQTLSHQAVEQTRALHAARMRLRTL